MAKSVFRNNEVTKKDEKVMLRLMHNYEPEVEEIEPEEVPEYYCPTVEDLRQESETFKIQWEAEKNRMLLQAQTDADTILRNAEDAAFKEVKRQTDNAAVIKTNAETKSGEILKGAQGEAQEIIRSALEKQEQIKKDAYDEGFKKGQQDGFQDGNQEANRLIDRLHTVLERILDKRQEILEETEQQVVDLVLLMTRKIVKVITENQRNIVMSNVVQALRKVKGRGDVTIRVNLADVKLTSEHTQEFMKTVESVKRITIVEDSNVDRGGCVVETDFGAIDARITSQLNELEQKILELSPIKTINKSAALTSEG